MIRNCTSGVRSDHQRKNPGQCIVRFQSDPPKTMIRWRFQRFLEFWPRNLGKWSSLMNMIFLNGLKPPPRLSKISKMAKFQHSGLSGVSLKLETWHLFKQKKWLCFHHRSWAYVHSGPPTSTPIARCNGRCIRHPKRCWTMARWSIRWPGRIGDSAKRLDGTPLFFLDRTLDGSEIRLTMLIW